MPRLIIPVVLLTVLWNSATSGVEGLTCHRCLSTEDQGLCNNPSSLGSPSQSQLLQCAGTGYCQVGVRLIPTVDSNNKIGIIMGRSCGTSLRSLQTKNLSLWIKRRTDARIACEETRWLENDRTATNFRCICPDDNCNNHTLPEILRLRMEQPFFDQERKRFVSARLGMEIVGRRSENVTVSPEMTGREEIDPERIQKGTFESQARESWVYNRSMNKPTFPK